MKNFYKFIAEEKNFNKSHFIQLAEYINYGSFGTINWVIDRLETIKERIENKEDFYYENSVFTIEVLKKIVEEYFTTYVYENVFKED